jgi:two-component system, NtrC family, sensor histidine kinase HydH
VELRTQTSFLAGLIALAIGVAVLLRSKTTRLQWWFGAFSLSVASWHLSTTLLSVLGTTPAWRRFNLVCAVLLPISAVGFLRLFIEEDVGPVGKLWKGALGFGAVLIALVCTPIYGNAALPASIFVYMSALLALSLAMLWRRAQGVRSRFVRRRLHFLVLTGTAAALSTAADYLPLAGLEIPPVGSILTLVFLYILSQAVLRDRLLDLYELTGRLAVLTALSFLLAAVFSLSRWITGQEFFLHSVAAALVVLLVYDPFRLKLEETISQLFFRERHDLERDIAALRRRLAHVLELEHLPDLVLAALESSERVTHASLYFLDAELRGYQLQGYLGSVPVRRIEVAAARPLLDALWREPGLTLESREREREARRSEGHDREAETSHEIVQCLEAMHASVCVPLSIEREIYGMLCIRDERVRDAFSPEEIQLWLGLGAQIVIAIENTRLYQRMKERDKLAAMGEMAAGLAHEIRNPLGAIKASAQYLRETPSSDQGGSDEFLHIIVDEVDRLNRVVSSFLDYANPAAGDRPMPCDVNAVVERTAQVLATEVEQVDLMSSLVLSTELPRVRIDAERLRQVLINLIQNALQAIESGGTLRIETRLAAASEALEPWVEISVSDTGKGVPQQVLNNLFQPFVTTRQKGTGLGLAISQRIVSAANGKIVVQTRQDQGSTFTIRLPAVASSAPKPSPRTQPGDEPSPSGALETPSISVTNR